MKAPKTLQEAILFFSDPENCRQFMIAVRWVDGTVRCPICDSEKVTYLAKARVYRCYGKHPKEKFSLKVGTIFEGSPIGLDKWLPAVWLLVSAKNGISSYELSRALGVTQKTAWFMLHRIRMAMQSESFVKFGRNNDPVEVDETFVGANPKNMHANRRAKIYTKGAGYGEHKTIVMGMLDRETRQVRATVIPNITRKILQEQILNEIEHGSTVYTDGHPGYEHLKAAQFVHETVNHMEEYVRGNVHTQGIENFWSLLKRGLKEPMWQLNPFIYRGTLMSRFSDSTIERGRIIR